MRVVTANEEPPVVPFFPVQTDRLDETVRAVLARELRVGENQLTDNISLDLLGLDDDSAPVVLGAVGDELDVRFPDDFFDGLHTYAEFASAVRLALGA
jgi:acyl carrier protein